MRRIILIALAALPLQSACAQEAPAPAPAANDEAIFAAAGFTETDGGWSKCGDPGTASYTSGAIEQRGDFNQDGLPDAVVIEGSAFCFGDTGTGYTLVSQQAGGGWTIMDERAGMLTFLQTAGSDGWPDISVGGPGFCHPVVRWNGTAYTLNRQEYEGKACTP